MYGPSETLFIIFMVLVMVGLICIMIPVDPKHNKGPGCRQARNIIANAVNWEECDKCDRLFPKKLMHKTDDNKYLCKHCHGLIQIYMDK